MCLSTCRTCKQRISFLAIHTSVLSVVIYWCSRNYNFPPLIFFFFLHNHCNVGAEAKYNVCINTSILQQDEPFSSDQWYHTQTSKHTNLKSSAHSPELWRIPGPFQVKCGGKVMQGQLKYDDFKERELAHSIIRNHILYFVPHAHTIVGESLARADETGICQSELYSPEINLSFL